MKPHALIFLAAALLLGAQTPADEAKKERDRLKGGWSVVSAEVDGQKTPAEKTDKVKVTFADEQMIVKEGERTIPASIKLDVSKKPRTIDITATDGEQKGKTMQGIYQLDGDMLKLCVTRPGKEGRPTDFATKEGSETMLLLLKRDK